MMRHDFSDRLHQEPPTRLRRPGALLLIPALLLICVVVRPAPAQVGSALPPLRRFSGGWFGFEESASADRLLTYDTSFTKTNESLWRDLQPRDFVPLRKVSGDTVGALLANPASSSLLYFVSGAADLYTEPIWQSSDNTFDRIVATVDDENDNPILVLRGDTNLVGVRTDGSVVYTLPLNIARYDVYDDGAPTLIGVERIGDRLFFVRITLANGTVQTRTLLEGSGDVLLARNATGADSDLLALAVSTPPTYFLLREGSRGFVAREHLEEFPDGIVPVSGPGLYAAVWNRMPAPRIQPLRGDGKPRTLVYPSDEPFRSIARNDRVIMLVGDRKSVVYDQSMKYVGTADVVGGANATIVPDSVNGGLLLVSDNGTERLVIEEDPLAWYRRNETSILLTIGIVLFLIAGFLIYRRVRYSRTVHANLLHGQEGEGIVLLNNRGRVARMNPQARRYLGVGDNPVVNAHITSYFASGALSQASDDIRRLVAAGVPFEREMARTGEDGERTLLLSGRTMTGRYGGANGYILTIRDITSSIERERLINWASVAHHIAHEMKTPLGTVRTSAELLRNELVGLPDPGISLHQAGRIIRQSSRLREIVDDLLTVARSQDLRFVNLDASLLVSSTIDDFAEYLDSNITIGFSREGDDFRVAADADKLAIAVRNVIDNARQAIGGTKEGRIDVRLTDSGDSIVISIADTGRGMSAETRERLFQPYYTEKEGGSGIGTMIIKRVIEGHGGTVGVQSELGKGTTFTLTIPRSGGARNVAEEES
jgi:PAS domain S-box-containing protein